MINVVQSGRRGAVERRLQDPGRARQLGAEDHRRVGEDDLAPRRLTQNWS